MRSLTGFEPGSPNSNGPTQWFEYSCDDSFCYLRHRYIQHTDCVTDTSERLYNIIRKINISTDLRYNNTTEMLFNYFIKLLDIK